VPALEAVYANNLVLQVLGMGLVMVPPSEMSWSRKKEAPCG
jgi:hypothetical protein